jgi:hypothetical protein
MAQHLEQMGAPAEVPLDVLNGRFDKRGSIVKRYGFLSKGSSGPSAIRRVWSTGEELYAADFDGVWSLLTETTSFLTWNKRGSHSPFGGQTVERWKDARSWDQCDAYANVDGPVVFGATAAQFPASAGTTFGEVVDRWVYASIYDQDGTCLCERQELASGARYLAVSGETLEVGLDTNPHSVRSIALNDRFGVSFVKNDKLAEQAYSDHGSIIMYGATLTTGPFSHAYTIADAWHDDINIRPYDTRPYRRGWDLDATYYHLAYIRWVDTTGEGAPDRGVRVCNYTNAHVQQYYLDIDREGYRAIRVAIGSDSSTAMIVLAVLWVDSATGNNFNLSVYRLTDGGASIVLHTTHNSVTVGDTSDEWFDNFGWGERRSSAGTITRWVLTYGHFTTEATPIAHTGVRTESVTMPANCASVTGPTKLNYNTIPQSQPFGANDDRGSASHTFVSLGSFNFDYTGRWFQKEYLFEVRGLFEVFPNDANWTEPTLEYRGRHASGVDCGMWRSLTNNHLTLFQGNYPWSLRCGSANSVSRPGASTVPFLERATYHLGNCQRAETIDQSAVLSYKQKHRLSACHTTLCMEPRRTEALVGRGGAMIGGAVPVWCDGATCHEQGFSLPPFVVDTVDDTGEGDSVAGTRRWNAIWATHDDRGLWHRGLPSADFVRVVLTGDAHDVYTKSNPMTMRRDPIPLVTVQLYRSDANNVMRRVLHPTAQVPNYQYGSILDGYLNQMAWDDHTDLTGIPLYTEGSVYESAAIEGCDIVHVALERVWMAGAFHRDAVYYSKRFAALDGVIAPEFHEAFSFVVPDGKAVTGLGSIGDRVLVFTGTKIYAVAGQGPADDGSANDFSQLVCVSPTVGCADPRSIVCTDEGVFFYSGESIHMVGPGLQVADVGQAVEDTLAAYDTVSGAVWWPEESCLVFVASKDDRSGSQLLVFDSRWKAWARWLIKRPVSGTTVAAESVCVHKGNLYVTDAQGYMYVGGPLTGYGDGNYGAARNYVSLDVSTGWIQSGGMAGWQLVRLASVFANYVASHTLNIAVYHDFATGTTDTSAYTITSGVNETVHRKPTTHKCQAARIRVYDGDTVVPAYGAGFKLAGIGAEVAPIGNSAKVAAARR